MSLDVLLKKILYLKDYVLIVTITTNFESFGHKKYIKKVKPTLSKILNNLDNDVDKKVLKGLREVDALLSKEKININEVSKMLYFSKLFGREQCYLSLINQ